MKDTYLGIFLIIVMAIFLIGWSIALIQEVGVG